MKMSIVYVPYSNNSPTKTAVNTFIKNLKLI